MKLKNSLNHTNSVYLPAQRLIIREWTDAHQDEDDLLAIESRPDVVRFLDKTVRDRLTIKTRLYVIRQGRWTEPRALYECAIELQTTRKAIGVCVLGVEDQVHRKGQLAYYLHPDYWGQGYASEACREMLRFGFAQMGLQHIRALCDAENNASLFVLNAIGMKQVGIFHEVKGEPRERLHYALEEHEWRAGQAE